MIVEVKETAIITKSYHCVLTEQEAIFLYNIMNKISGSTKDSPRKHADSIFQGLIAKVKDQFCELIDGNTHGKDFKK
mgnify:CR=1 FL=1